MEYYSTKKNEILPFATMWMDLVFYLVKEVRERQMMYKSLIYGI